MEHKVCGIWLVGKKAWHHENEKVVELF